MIAILADRSLKNQRKNCGIFITKLYVLRPVLWKKAKEPDIVGKNSSQKPPGDPQSSTCEAVMSPNGSSQLVL